MSCPGGIDDKERQRLDRLNSILGPPHDATCSICGSTVNAYLVGGQWVLKQHDTPLRRPTKGKATKQPAGKLVLRSKYGSPSFKTGKPPRKRRPGKRVSRKR